MSNYSAKITYVSASGKAGIIVVEDQIGPMRAKVASGWVGLEPGCSKGQEFEIPKSTSFRNEQRELKDEAGNVVLDKDSGNPITFSWLITS